MLTAFGVDSIRLRQRAVLIFVVVGRSVLSVRVRRRSDFHSVGFDAV